MTFPPVIRIFFALDLPVTVKQALGTYISMLKKKSKSHNIRWTIAENLHITLQFLAEVHTEHLTTLINNVRREMLKSNAYADFSLGNVSVFPNPYRPRVIVIQITEQDDLTDLAERIGRGITQSNYAIEDRPFRAHLTLGRIKQPHAINLRFLTGATPPLIEKMLIKEVVIFRSEPQMAGSKYSVLERIPVRV